MGGPDANTDRWKQPISAVRVSWGVPGNVENDWFEVTATYPRAQFVNHAERVTTLCKYALTGLKQNYRQVSNIRPTLVGS